MRALFTSMAFMGHFFPLVPLIEAFLRRGDEVAVAAPQDLAALVSATGAAFFPMGHPGEEGLRPLWMRLQGKSGEEGLPIAVGEIFAGACAGAALPGLIEILERWRPVIVVRESQEYAAVVATDKLKIPRARVVTSAPSGEFQLLPHAAPFVDAHRARVGLGPDPSARSILEEAALSRFPLSLERPETVPANVLRFRKARKIAPALPSWWQTPQAPFVYITLGTVIGGLAHMRWVYRTILDAVVDLPIRVLLTLGGSDLPFEALGAVPPNVHVERFIHEDDVNVMPHAAAVVCHGGAGTMLGALSSGVPLVVVAPPFSDQPFNAERVAAVGAGLALPLESASAESIRKALSRVLDEPSFGAGAQRIAAEIGALPDMDQAVLELERLTQSS